MRKDYIRSRVIITTFSLIVLVLPFILMFIVLELTDKFPSYIQDPLFLLAFILGMVFAVRFFRAGLELRTDKVIVHGYLKTTELLWANIVDVYNVPPVYAPKAWPGHIILVVTDGDTQRNITAWGAAAIIRLDNLELRVRQAAPQGHAIKKASAKK